jgi:hypothetical protein
MPMQRLGRGEWISKGEFHVRLGRWFRETDEPTIGDPGAHPRTAWVWIRDGHRLARLYADTTRAGAAEYIALLRSHHGELEWSIVSSARGQPTKVAFGPERRTLEGFHLYIDPTTVPRRALPARGAIDGEAGEAPPRTDDG